MFLENRFLCLPYLKKDSKPIVVSTWKALVAVTEAIVKGTRPM